MPQKISLILTLILLISCANNNSTNEGDINTVKIDFTIAFGSCNKQTETNKFWNEVLKNNPNLWIWAGDNIYADTENMSKMAQDYATQNSQPDYANFKNSVEILGTWDDHDYGKNDGGKEYVKRAESLQLFLDFMGVSQNDARRNRSGIYHSKVFTTSKGSIKIIILDTRYFRDTLIFENFAYQPNENGTILGETQWQWFTNELSNSNADFNVIVSSIQILSSEHPFEKWANFPKELEKFKDVVKNANANGVLILSGDRHLSEFSKEDIAGLNYPLIDFTSSGLTHSYSNYFFEPNSKRELAVISSKSFGILNFNFDTKKITMLMKGENNKTLQELAQTYP